MSKNKKVLIFFPSKSYINTYMEEILYKYPEAQIMRSIIIIKNEIQICLIADRSLMSSIRGYLFHEMRGTGYLTKEQHEELQTRIKSYEKD